MTRPGLKETVGISVNASDLSSNPNRETAVDRVAALGFSDPLGAALWRLKVGGDLSAWKPAVMLLAHAAREVGVAGSWKLKGLKDGTPALLLRLCEQVLAEWLHTNCERCKGRGLTGLARGGVDTKKKPCVVCHGVGRVEYVGNLSQQLLAAGQANFKQRIWHRNKTSTLKPAVMTLYETEVPVGTIGCPGCSGRGWNFATEKKNPKERACKTCKGTGQRRINGVERANVVGVTTAAYYRNWAPRFDAVRAIIKRYDLEAFEDVRTVLRGPR